MFSPDAIDYSRIDVTAILETRGIAVVDELRANACLRWLDRNSYDVSVVDFSLPPTELFTELGELFNWEQQFGYRFENGQGNLNALADGFSFPVSASRGQVLCVRHPEALAATDPSWFDAFLDIASNHSLFHLACGSRFFLLLCVARQSPLPGRPYGTCNIPIAYWNANARRHGFLE